ncbi:hypothetical protein [Xanthomonas hortorum]|uniref:hypothetical protein n=1 Tax=Xanthomonas hortorum TaxID=56454 RepID=UPI001C3E2EC3|nr:hypothetical protein [Xanthomonas hortorum]NHF66993.1 hypothetical protein [Xanthomonas hortorum]
MHAPSKTRVDQWLSRFKTGRTASDLGSSSVKEINTNPDKEHAAINRRSGTAETVRNITNHKLIRYTNKICRLVCSGSLEVVTCLIRIGARSMHHPLHRENANLSTIYAEYDWMSLVVKSRQMRAHGLASEPNNRHRILLKDAAMQKFVYAAGNQETCIAIVWRITTIVF